MRLVLKVCLAAMGVMVIGPATRAGDAAKAKRDLTMVQMSVESSRWDDANENLKKANADMDGLSDAEKAPLLAKLTQVKADASKAIEEDVTKRLDRAAKADAGMAGHDLDMATTTLNSDEAKSFLDAATAEKLRARLTGMRSGSGGAAPPMEKPPEPKVTPPAVSSEAHDQAYSRARRNLMFAKTKLERGPEGVAELLKQVDDDLPLLTESERAPLAADVAAARKQIGGGGSAPVTNAPANTTTPPVSNVPIKSDQDRAEAIARAKRNLTFAKMSLERGPDGVEDQLKKVENDLPGLTEAERAPLAAEVASIRQQMGGSNFNSEKSKLVERGIKQDLDMAEQILNDKAIEAVMERLNRAKENLNSSEAKENLDPAVASRLQTRLDELTRRAPEAYKATVFKQTLPYLSRIEKDLAANPFKGARYAFPIMLEINRRVERVRSDVQLIPTEDADARAIAARLTEIQRKSVELQDGAAKEIAAADAAAIAAAAAAEKQRLIDQAAQAQANAVKKAGGDLKETLASVKGWDQETQPDDARKFESSPMPKTRAAARQMEFWFDGTSSVRSQYKDDAALTATVAQAQKARDEIYAKLNGGYSAALDQVEKMEVPTVWTQQSLPGSLATRAGYDLAGSSYQQATVARAKALQAKWDAAIADAKKAHEELVERLSAEAATKWASIEPSMGATTTFDPSNPGALNGKTIELKGVYNRSGWDFAGSEWNFTVKVNGVPVAGDYVPAVLAAFREGQQKIHDNIDEHKPWDIIGVVEGTGTVTERIIDDVRIGDTMDKVKIERNVKEPCLKLRIIAMRAGPVAVGSK